MAKIFVKLFLIDLDQRMTLVGYKRQKMTLCNSNHNLLKNMALKTQNKNTAYS